MNKNVIFGCIGGAIGLLGFGYVMGASARSNELCRTIERKIEDVAAMTPVELEEAIVERAVEKAAEQAARIAVHNATNKVIKDVERDINSQIRTAVDASYTELKAKISKDMAKKAANIDMQELKDEVVVQAKAKVLEKFDDNLDSILDKFNNDLNNVSKIYKSIANSMSKSE